MSNNLFGIFLNKTYTKSQAKSRLLALKTYFNKLFFKTALDLTISQDNQAWIDSLDKSFLSSFNKDNLTQILKSFDEEINKLVLLIVYLPFEMPIEEQEKLGLWLRQKIAKNIIYDIKIDLSLIGGLALSYKGIYQDYSLKQSLSTQKENILKSFKSYMP